MDFGGVGGAGLELLHRQAVLAHNFPAVGIGLAELARASRAQDGIGEGENVAKEVRLEAKLAVAARRSVRKEVALYLLPLDLDIEDTLPGLQRAKGNQALQLVRP